MTGRLIPLCTQMSTKVSDLCEIFLELVCECKAHSECVVHRPPSRRRISELAAKFLSAEYQPKKIRLAESAAEFLVL